MFGPTHPDDRARFGRGSGDDEWRPDDATTDEECELCQSEASTSLRYGMRVCPTCDRRYLP